MEKIKKTPKNNAVDYVDDELFYITITKYIQEYNIAKENNQKLPEVPEYVGECIMKIANKLSNHVQFFKYPYKEEMIADGIENCLRYITNFDYVEYKKPFAYFTQIIWYAFWRRMAKEKLQLYVKFKSIQESVSDHDQLIKLDRYGSEYNNEKMTKFIEDYERSNFIKSENKKTKKRVDNSLNLLDLCSSEENIDELD